MSANHRPRLDLKTNIPMDVKFRFASPLEKEGQYGPFDVWTVEVDGEEYGLLASDGLREALRDASPNAGEVLQLCKTERENGKGFVYTAENPTKGKSEGVSKPEDEPEGEEKMIEALAGRYVSVCKELTRQWPELHEKDGELFKSAATSIFIQLSRNGRY